MNPASSVSRNPAIVARELAGDDGAVLLHLDSGAYHSLNQVGFLVWDLIDGQRTVADLVQAVRFRIKDAPPRVQEDVIRFLEGARDRDLVRIDEEPSSAPTEA